MQILPTANIRRFFIVVTLFSATYATAQTAEETSTGIPGKTTVQTSLLPISNGKQTGGVANVAATPAVEKVENKQPERIGSIDSDTMRPSKSSPWLLVAEAIGSSTSGDVVPFWMRANKYGSIPPAGFSSSFIGHVERQYRTNGKHFFNWGFSLEGRANVGSKTDFTLIEGYGKIKLGPFEIKGGRSKEIIGLTDSTLSAGSFSVAGNSLGIPKVEIGIPVYTHIFGGKLFAFKGNVAHGWLGVIPNNREMSINTYFHQKSLYGRFGRPDWKVRLHAGFNHNAFWGSEKKRYGSSYKMSDWETFVYVLEGKRYEGTSSKIGNHLGSIDLALELNFTNLSVFAYRQNFYEVGGLYYLANIQDGLNGVRLENKKASSSKVKWKKILFEFMYTKNQAGEPWSKNTPTGVENYYNNSEYKEGWSYKQLGLGTPFISTKISTRPGFPSAPYDFFNNNRIILYHTGFEGSIDKFLCTVKLSYSQNFGNWRTSEYGYRKGGPANYREPSGFGIFQAVNQFSGYLELARPINNGFIIGGALAVDKGELLENSVGGQLKLAKFF